MLRLLAVALSVLQHQEEPPIKAIELHAILFALQRMKERNTDGAIYIYI